MARVPYLSPDDLSAADRPALERRPINISRALASHPGVLRSFGDMGEFIRYGGMLDPRLRELAILQVGWVTRNDYEFSHHVRVALDFGLSQADIDLVRRPAAAEPDERAAGVIKAATEITADRGLTDATWQRVAHLLGTVQAIELVMVVSHYCMVVCMLNSLQVDVEPDYRQYVPDFPPAGGADSSDDDVIAQVRAADDRRYAAMLAADAGALAGLLSEDLVYVHTTGDTDTRKSYLEAVRTGFVQYRHLERRDETFTVRPGAVLSAGRQLGLSLLQGSPGLIDASYLAAWALEEGSWRLAAWHATRYAPTR